MSATQDLGKIGEFGEEWEDIEKLEKGQETKDKGQLLLQ